MEKLAKGERLGSWTLVSKIQAGGNGVVWRVTGPDGKPAAVKVLTKLKDSAVQRFRGEIEILRTH
jgi:serine/threonine protein kinase